MEFEVRNRRPAGGNSRPAGGNPCPAGSSPRPAGNPGSAGNPRPAADDQHPTAAGVLPRAADARSGLRRAFAAASIAWVIILPLAAFAASRPHGGAIVFGFAYGAYAIGSLICHQLPARSFRLWSTPLPVCARCAGIYAGAAAAAALGLAGHLAPRLATASRARRILAVAAMPTAATLIDEWTTGDTPVNWMRALAGVPIGAAVAWIVGEVD
jgi:uncharacterized membrane protein